MNEQEQARSEALSAAIDGVLKDHAEHDSDRGLTTDWILIVEQIGADGETYLRLIHSDESVQWRRLGLLDYAATTQRAIIHADYLSDD